METDDKFRIAREAEQFLNDKGLTVVEFVNILGSCKASGLQLNASDKKMFCQLYDEISDGGLNTKEKGHKLEELCSVLFSNPSSSFFECRRNCRTSTNEIDLLLTWSERARLSGINSAFPCFGDEFLCECKNYDESVDVTCVGKFYSLLSSVKASMGILVAWNGITGKGNWDAAKGLIRKIALKDDMFILTLDKEDLKTVARGECHIYALIHEKYNALRNDIDFSKYISKHSAEGKL